MNYEKTIDPILNVKFDIYCTEEKFDLIVKNNGTIDINDINIYYWPRIVSISGLQVVAGNCGGNPWISIDKLLPNDDPKKFSIKELLHEIKMDGDVFKSFHNDKSGYYAVLLVSTTYCRPNDKKQFRKDKYLFVTEDSKTKKTISFDLDETPYYQRYKDLRSALKKFDEK